MKTRKTFDNSQFRNFAISCVVLLAGCGIAPPTLQRVEVPVFTPCVKVVPQLPVYEFDQLAPAATDGEIILALARDWPRGRKYEGELEAIIEGCRSVASPPSVQVLDLLPRPAPGALKEALQPIPPSGYLLTRWLDIFKP